MDASILESRSRSTEVISVQSFDKAISGMGGSLYNSSGKVCSIISGFTLIFDIEYGFQFVRLIGLHPTGQNQA